MNIGSLQFIRPLWLLGLIPSLILYYFLLKYKKNANPWKKICSPLLYQTFIKQKKYKKNYSLHFLIFSWILTILSLSGPSLKEIKTPLYNSANSIMIVLNLSPNMLATDIKPNRLIRARYFIEDLLQVLGDGKIGLIVYSQGGHIVTPLTSDINTIKHLLPVLDPNIMPDHGNNALEALKMAIDSLKETPGSKNQILLISNRINQETLIQITNLSQKNKIMISTLGLGTISGSPIYNNKNYYKNEQGNLHLSKLDPKNLQLLSHNTGGIYATLHANSELFIRSLLEQQNKQLSSVHNNYQKHREDLGFYLIFLILPILLLFCRKEALLSLVLFICIFHNEPSYAWDMLHNKNTQAFYLFKKNNNKKALDIFDDPNWKATAAYKNKNYEQALKWYQKNKSSDNYYNQGNTLVKLNKLDKSLAAYKKAIEINPKNKDAQYNYKLIKKILDKQKKQQNKSKQNKQQAKNKKSQKKQPKNKKPQEKKTSENNKQDQQNKKFSKNQAKNSQESLPKKKKQSQESQPNNPKPSSAKKDANNTQDKNHQEKLNITEADKQWLQQIPDNPGELLRRKFLLEKQLRENNYQ